VPQGEPGDHADIGGEEEERCPDQLVRPLVEPFDLLHVHPPPLSCQAPNEDEPGCAFDEAVDAEREEGDAARERSGADSDQTLDNVPPDGQVLEAQRVLQERNALGSCARLVHEITSIPFGSTERAPRASSHGRQFTHVGREGFTGSPARFAQNGMNPV
jgi:hypothetical protein